MPIKNASDKNATDKNAIDRYAINKSATDLAPIEPVINFEEKCKEQEEKIINLENKWKIQEEELQILREVLAAIGSGQGDMREAKPLDLFRKSRLTSILLEREKTRISNMKKASEIMQQQQELDENLEKEKSQISSMKKTSKTMQQKELQNVEKQKLHEKLENEKPQTSNVRKASKTMQQEELPKVEKPKPDESFEKDKTRTSSEKEASENMQQEELQNEDISKLDNTDKLEAETTRTCCVKKPSEQQEVVKPKPDIENLIRQELEFWVDKVHRVNKKLEVTQANEHILEKQVQRLQFVLRREVGEHIPIAKVIEEGTGWVGRSELISKLKGKVEELKVQVKVLQPTPINGYNTIQNDERRTVELLHKMELEKMDDERRVQYDNLIQEFLVLRASWAVQKKRLDGAIARRNILEKEIRGAKAKMQILLKKSINDDLLIQALTVELGAAKQALGPPFLKPGGPLQLDHHARCNKLAASFHELKTQCYEQEMTLKCQGEIIQTFQDTVEDPSCGDWCTSTMYEGSQADSAPEEGRDPNDPETKDRPYFLESPLDSE